MKFFPYIKPYRTNEISSILPLDFSNMTFIGHEILEGPTTAIIQYDGKQYLQDNEKILTANNDDSSFYDYMQFYSLQEKLGGVFGNKDIAIYGYWVGGNRNTSSFVNELSEKYWAIHTIKNLQTGKYLSKQKCNGFAKIFNSKHIRGIVTNLFNPSFTLTPQFDFTNAFLTAEAVSKKSPWCSTFLRFNNDQNLAGYGVKWFNIESQISFVTKSRIEYDNSQDMLLEDSFRKGNFDIKKYPRANGEELLKWWNHE